MAASLRPVPRDSSKINRNSDALSLQMTRFFTKTWIALLGCEVACRNQAAVQAQGYDMANGGTSKVGKFMQEQLLFLSFSEMQRPFSSP